MKLPNEIIAYSDKLRDIESQEKELSKIESDIIEKYCPYKNGDKVVYTEWWRDNGKDYFGIVDNIRFKGINADAIDQKWVICVRPSTKDFNMPKGGYNSSFVYLGKNKLDKIKKYIS